MDRDAERRIPRRHFVKSALAIGGASALSACAQREIPIAGGEGAAEPTGTPTVSEPTYPQGDPEALPQGQHRWSEYLVRDAADNTVPPQHQLVLGLEYRGSTPPAEAERSTVEAALRTLEHAFQWGTGGDPSAHFNRGLLSLLGYAPRYFETVGSSAPDVMAPDALLEAVGEDPAKTDGFDAVLVLTSDVASIVLAAEEALFGRKTRLNGVPVEASIEDVFSVSERRTGFMGQGLPAEKLENDDIPEEAPLSMGFKSGFTDSLPGEDAVTLQEGPFASGTTLALSRLHLDLERWYEHDHEERVDRMFCPAHDAEDVGEVGTNLGNDSGIDEQGVNDVDELAREHDVYGHTAKVATARDEEFEVRVLRRSEGFATDVPEGAGFNFTSVQRDLEAFVDVRKAMNVEEHAVSVPAEDHGIVDYIETIDRGTFVVPPRSRRALPTVEQ